MILKILILILCSCSINTLNYMSRLNKRIFWEDLGIKSTRTIQSTYNGYINQKICLTCPIDRKMYYDIYNFSNLKAMTPGEYPNSIPFSWFIYGNFNNNNIQLCSLKTAAGVQNARTGSVEIVNSICNCQGLCKSDNRRKCFKIGKKCTSHCHLKTKLKKNVKTVKN